MVILLSACGKSFNILTVSGSCYYLNMFSTVSRQLWSLGSAGGLGRDLLPCAYAIQKRKQSRKAGCTRACRCFGSGFLCFSGTAVTLAGEILCFCSVLID